MLEKRREEETREKGGGKRKGGRRIRQREGREEEGRQNQKQSEALRSRLPPRSKPSADHTDERVENLPSRRVYRQRTKGCFRGF